MNVSFDKLDEVKRAFNHWSSTRNKQGKIPGYLWEQVKPLLGQGFFPRKRTQAATTHARPRI